MLDRRRFLLSTLTGAAVLRAGWDTERWPARWITVPGAPPKGYGVYAFRRTFDLPSKPAAFRVHVTGDMRYALFVNGERVSWGPARSDLFHWRYETVDLAPFLQPGRNALAAVVWNEGEFAGLAQIGNRTGFLLQGDTRTVQIADTGREWKCTALSAYKPYPITPANRVEYWAVGPGEEFDSASYPWNWQQPGFDDSAWPSAQVLSNGSPRGGNDGPNAWMLVPRPIPPMEETPEPFPSFEPFTVPANTRRVAVFDLGRLTTAFPELTLSGGAGARVVLKYVEGPRSPNKYGPKPHRGRIEGASLFGPEDVIHADGQERIYRPLFWRCYRYIELTVEAKDQPVRIAGLRGIYTGYPFVRKATFEGGPADLRQILDVGWRTARLCAHETYMDTPFYEQLQYVGDTRIQALVSLYEAGDARLMRNAIEQIDSSRTAEGATFSRAPSALQQYIPPFSLWWIGMVHDYWMYVDDAAFAQSMLPGVRAVLGFFSRYQMQDGRLKRMPWWNYIDWVERGRWPASSGPQNEDGMSAIHELQLLLAYRWAAELEHALGESIYAGKCRAEAAKLAETIRRSYWDGTRGLFADTLDRRYWSQHANSLAILAGLVTGDQARSVMEKTLSDPTLVPASIYFQFYVRLAMREAGLGDRYLSMLDRPWRWALSYGFTTWPETDSPGTRSDCHAWGASPNVELYRTVLGIDTAAPGFSRVRIRPHLGTVAQAAGSIPHPRGTLKVQYSGRDAIITTPVPGELVWHGRTVPLRPGENKVTA